MYGAHKVANNLKKINISPVSLLKLESEKQGWKKNGNSWWQKKFDKTDSTEIPEQFSWLERWLCRKGRCGIIPQKFCQAFRYDQTGKGQKSSWKKQSIFPYIWRGYLMLERCTALNFTGIPTDKYTGLVYSQQQINWHHRQISLTQEKEASKQKKQQLLEKSLPNT